MSSQRTVQTACQRCTRSSETSLYVLFIMITQVMTVMPRSCQETSGELLFVAHRCDGQVLDPQSSVGQVGKNDEFNQSRSDAFRLLASLLVYIRPLQLHK